MSKQYYILMADIVQSGAQDGQVLMQAFKPTVTAINQYAHSSLLSPLTITLGDEFQGIAKSYQDAISIIVQMEERIIRSGLQYQLRYVLIYGRIDTKINPDIAHEMLGEGLTRARQLLGDLKKHRRKRVWIDTQRPDHDKAMMDAFFIFQSVVEKWKIKDLYLVKAFLEHVDYKVVAQLLKKDKSLIWRREKSLGMTNYFAIRNIILFLAGL